MRKLSVEVHEDHGRPGGGHAVIRLIGLDSLPDSLTYRIKPVDGAHAVDGVNAWAEGDRVPLATRMTAEGAELVVGPEIVENPAFLPGTLAVIEIAKCGVRGEFLWPRISPLVRPRRRHLLGVKPQRDLKPEVVSEIIFEEAHDASSDLVPEPAPPAASPSVAAPVPPGPVVDPIVMSETGEPGALKAAIAAAAELNARREDISDTARSSAASAVRDVAWTVASPPRKSSHMRLAAAAAGGALMVALAANAFLGSPVPPLPAGTSPPGVAAALPRDGDGLVLARELTVGTMSPKGVDARDVNPQRLLEDADTRLHGPDAERDKTEAAFLLRRFLAATLAEERTLWALTQLGSVYAEPAPGEARDYARARQLWEVASALGDPIAMCFLGSLHEHGLGIGANRETALQWYRRAKEAGGCREVDVAIARLQKGVQR